MRLRITYTDHLVALVGEAAAAAARLESVGADTLAALAARAAVDRARLSLRLDASPLTDETATAVDEGRFDLPATVARPVPAAGGWAAALRLEGMATQQVAAVEYANLKAAHAAEAALADTFFEDPMGALATLHGLMCQGLVDPEVVGRPRRTAQAIHDGAQGMVIFNAPDPETVPGLLADLAGWLRGSTRSGSHPASAALPAVVVAGVVHERLLEWQPFEAANGRLARSAAALILRARGLDANGVAVCERSFVRDLAAYLPEVAATRRRQDDLTPWVEWQAEAAVAALDAAVGLAGRTPAPPAPGRARDLAAGLQPGDTVTVLEYARQLGVTRETAWADLRRLAAAGLVARDPRTRGMRYRRV